MIATKKLTRGKDVTPKGDIAEDEEVVLALEKATRKPRKSYSLFDAKLSIGEALLHKSGEGRSSPFPIRT